VTLCLLCGFFLLVCLPWSFAPRDAKVFSKVKARVGLERVRLMLTGSAPIAAHVLDFLRAVFG
jgi:long-subunit acyl-CoA synthetase (AMP-forming)